MSIYNRIKKKGGDRDERKGLSKTSRSEMVSKASRTQGQSFLCGSQS